jgi:hypothetical protein
MRVVREHSTNRVTILCLGAVVLIVIHSIPAAAHVGTTHGVSGLPFWWLLTTSAVGGLLGGIGLSHIGHRLPTSWSHRLESGIHVLVSVIGATLVVPALYDTSIPGIVGTTVGSTIAGIIIVTVHRRPIRYMGIITGSVYTHRAMEGFALAAAYLSGTTIGIVGAFVLTIHAAFEIAAVYLGQSNISRRGGLRHAVGIQSTLLVTGAMGITVGSLPETVRSLVVPGVGGALLVAGIQGIRMDREPTEPTGLAEHE